MKPIQILTFCALALALLLPNVVTAQFSNSKGEPIAVCDCRKMMNDLYVTVTLPEGAREFDILGFQLIVGDGSLGYRSYYSSYLAKGPTATFNILSPDNLGSRDLLGVEDDLFQGKDFTGANYGNICYGKEASTMYVRVIGIKQSGTQTTYEVQNNGTIIGRTQKLYDGGTVIGKTEELAIIPNGLEYPSKKIKKAVRWQTVGLIATVGIAWGLAQIGIKKN